MFKDLSVPFLAVGLAIAFSGCHEVKTTAFASSGDQNNSTTFVGSVCPNLDLHETAADCPWAGASRDLTGITDSVRIRGILNNEIPAFVKELDRDGASPELIALWGLSSNIDASNLASGLHTIPDNLIQFIARQWNIDYAADSSFGSAAANHTYGYLFSNVWTPYGYKRARYVQGELESGFQVTDGLFGGTPGEGTLLSNLTLFAGNIALKDSPESWADFQKAITDGHIVPVPELMNYNYGALNVKRLVEVVQNEQFYLELRTDIVKFPFQNTHGADQDLLIYSLDYHAAGGVKKPKIITVFPVADSFGAGIFNPANLGDNVSIALKYNAVSPVTIQASQMVGKRFIANDSSISITTGN